jgi:dihydroorotate dehydrogenase (fumarate)
MLSLETKYMGLSIKNPLIVSSSGLTNSLSQIKEMADNGAGAVVLKSIFEEQIRHEAEKLMNDKDNIIMQPMLKGYDDIMKHRNYDYTEAMEYLSNFAKEHTLKDYLKFIQDVKETINIPVIASINCIYTYDWHSFAKKIEEAGADAIELNVYILPSDLNTTGVQNEEIYFKIIENVKKYVSIPISLKIGFYFSGLANKVIELSKTGIKGLVLFNRPYNPNIDINTFEITVGNIYSSPEENAQTLRWVALLSGHVGCDIAANTGIHTYEDLIKQLLAGANVVQIASVLYKHGIGEIKNILNGMKAWMESKNFKSIDDFRGMLSYKNIPNPAAYERVQFMKLYSQIE